MISPQSISNPTVALLTPGVYNSAYYEHSFLARQMGVPLVEGRDLLVDNHKVYMKTTTGLEQVHVLYRRIDTTVNGITYDSVYEYSVSTTDTLYNLGWTYIGPGQGDYTQSTNVAANGTVGSTRKASAAGGDQRVWIRRNQRARVDRGMGGGSTKGSGPPSNIGPARENCDCGHGRALRPVGFAECRT